MIVRPTTVTYDQQHYTELCREVSMSHYSSRNMTTTTKLQVLVGLYPFPGLRKQAAPGWGNR